MALQSVQIVCGNGICQAGETASNCATDCAPKIMDYISCVFNSSGCVVQSWPANMNEIILVILLIGFIIYLKRKRFF